METKKTSKADVKRNSSIYFAVGLIVMLLTTNYAINYQTSNNVIEEIAMLDSQELEEEIIPITKQIETPPETKPQAPEIIEIIEDDPDLEESVIQSSEIDDTTEIVDVDDVMVDEPEEDVLVPFAFIENVPVFPGCDSGNNDMKRKCMSQKISKHVQRKFNTNMAADLGLRGRQRISVVFKIDKTGNVIEVQSRAPHPSLEKEAARVINLLPKMKPGKQRGEAVKVSYSIPIVFQVEN